MTTSFLSGWSYALPTLVAADIGASVRSFSVAVVGAASALLVLLIIMALVTHRHWPGIKTSLFTLIVLVSVMSTLVLGGAGVYLAVNSPTGGPVRWGADYQVWACGNQLELRDAHRLFGNHLGTATLYEANDSRIHFEGTPSSLPDDVSLGKFMATIGGEISDSSLVVPLNDQNGFAGTPARPEEIQPFISTDRNGVSARFVNGQSCGSDKAQVQTFVYHYSEATKTYRQTKLDYPANDELSHTDSSPPGDCVIVEFAPPTDRTDHLCASYGVRDYDRCTDFGVAADKIARCDIREQR